MRVGKEGPVGQNVCSQKCLQAASDGRQRLQLSWDPSPRGQIRAFGAGSQGLADHQGTLENSQHPWIAYVVRSQA